nr:hypothetical protein [Emcibacter nanhaiensis]
MAVAAGIERTGVCDAAAVEQDAAAMLGDAFSFDNAAVVHHAGEQVPGTACGEDHHTVTGAYGAFVLDQPVQVTPVDRDGDQTVTGEVESDIVARCQCRAAVGGINTALVFHDWRHQGHNPATGKDVTEIFHCGGIVRVDKVEMAGKEIFISDVEGGGGNAANIDLAAITKNNTRRIDKHDMTVGVEPPQDLTWVLPQHTVERNAAAGGLVESDTGIGTDVKALPGDNHLLGILPHEHAGAVLANSAGTGSDLPTGGQRIHGGVSQGDTV